MFKTVHQMPKVSEAERLESQPSNISAPSCFLGVLPVQRAPQSSIGLFPQTTKAQYPSLFSDFTFNILCKLQSAIATAAATPGIAGTTPSVKTTIFTWYNPRHIFYYLSVQISLCKNHNIPNTISDSVLFKPPKFLSNHL